MINVFREEGHVVYLGIRCIPKIVERESDAMVEAFLEYPFYDIG